jgi:hypothetical protein
MSAGASLPHHVATEDWSVSLGDFLEHLDVQSLITNNSFESNVLLFERLKSLRFLALHAAVLAAPAAQRRLADHERLQHLADAPACRKLASASRSFLTICSGVCRFRFFIESPFANDGR